MQHAHPWWLDRVSPHTPEVAKSSKSTPKIKVVLYFMPVASDSTNPLSSNSVKIDALE